MSGLCGIFSFDKKNRGRYLGDNGKTRKET